MITTIDVRPLLARQHVPALQHEFARCELEITYVRIAQRCLLFNNLRFIILDGLARSGTEDITVPPQSTQTTRVILFNAYHITSYLTTKLFQDAAFHDLMFLDLSYTCRVENFNISRPLLNLRIVKLCGLGLTSIPPFILDLGTRLWSLDLRDNLLPDSSIPVLLAKCFKENYPNLDCEEVSDDDYLYDNPPVYRPPHSEPSPSMDFIPLRPDSVFSFVQYVTDNGAIYKNQISRILPPTDPLYIDSGLTHLYLSGNKLSSPMVDILLRSQNRLQVLDIGSTKVNSLIPYKTMYLTQYGCDSITPVSGCRLERLRIHHSAVTRIPTILRSESARGYDLESLLQAEDMYGKISPRYLSPKSHHRLKFLTLTDIPTKSYGPIINQLTRLLSECATQERKLAAVREAMPDSRRAPQVLSGLKTLRLEFLPQASMADTGSVSGDRDADGFLEQTLGDFSFFGGSGGAEWVEKKGKENVNDNQERKMVQEPKDVVEALRVFRRAQKPAGWGGTLELVWPRGR